MLQGAKESKVIVCPKCHRKDSFATTFKNKNYIRYCFAIGCNYEEVIKIDYYEEEM